MDIMSRSALIVLQYTHTCSLMVILMYYIFDNKNGFLFQDLTHLNRSLNRVIIIDTDPASVKLQQENSIILNKWTGDIYDNSLNDLASFLLSNNLPCGQLLV